MKENILSFILVFACLPSLLFARISILKPLGLQEWWDRNNGTQDVHTSIAAFGHIPWGKKVLGHVDLADPLNACSFIRSPTNEDTLPDPILIAVRGDCPFYLKAHYAQLAGAQMLIIVDNQYEDVEAKLMVDSGGQGESINIPSVLLGKSGGSKIIESLRSTDKSISDIYVLFDFSIPKNEKVNYHLWLTSSSTQTFRFLKYWEPYEAKLSNVTTMEPHFSHFQLPVVDLAPPSSSSSPSPDLPKPIDNNCICGGRYCATDPDGDLPNNGRDVILEDLRQMCLLKEYGLVRWWQYIRNYDESCLNGGSMLACSKGTMSEIDVDFERIQDCIVRSFILESNLTTCYGNKLLNDEEDVMRTDGSFLYPSVFINGFMYRGSLVPGKGLFEAICESFKDLPDACVEHFDNPNGPIASSAPVAAEIATRHWPTVLVTIIFLVVFGFFIFCCYRRHLKKEMYRQMVRDVNVAVSQYIAFKDDEIGKAEEAS